MTNLLLMKIHFQLPAVKGNIPFDLSVAHENYVFKLPSTPI
jgi:hypothetical protein